MSEAVTQSKEGLAKEAARTTAVVHSGTASGGSAPAGAAADKLVSQPELQLKVPKAPPGSTQQMQYLGRDVAFKVDVQDKSFIQDPTSILSTLAIIVSIASAVYNVYLTRSAEAKARKLSIDDDFWLRTVLYPLAIQPALDFYSKVSTELPLDRYDPNATQTAVETFQSEFDQGHTVVLSKAISIQVLSVPLYQAILNELELIDDLVSSYCFANSNGYDAAATGTDYVRGAIGHKIAGHLGTILQAVKLSQATIG